ncbi:MAG: hypothetical protein ACLPVY_13890 [Acidimicrobiia bacterium]
MSGTGCAPGLLLSSSQDFVEVSATTVPPVSAHVAVAASGAWNDAISIPTNAVAAPAVVTAVCFSGGLQSLLTIYVPNTFTVTQAPAATTTATDAPTTPPTTSPTGGVATTTTNAPATTVGATPTSTTGNTTSTTTSGSTGGPPKSHDPKGGSGTGGTTGTDPSTPGTGSSAGNGPGAPFAGHASDVSHQNTGHDAKDQSAVRAADLADPTLASTVAGGGSDGLGWVAWLLLAVVCAAVVALGLWMFWWRRRDIEVRSAAPQA